MRGAFHITIFCSSALAALLASCTKPVTEVAGCDFPEQAAMELVWSDEFETQDIDQLKWSFDTADGCQLGSDLCGWGNNELQYYTSRSDNAYVEDGKLVIQAQKEVPAYLGQYGYTSARMVTKYKGDWRYGRVEVRARVPYGQGIWSAIWMLPTDTLYGQWPASGEIDIMEHIGSQPNTILGTVHYGHDTWRYYSQELVDDSINFSQGYHLFSADWNENCIQFYVDGRKIGGPVTRSTVLPSTYPFDQKFHLILNIAVGGNLPGNPSPTTTFPQKFLIDYVRIYQEPNN